MTRQQSMDIQAFIATVPSVVVSKIKKEIEKYFFEKLTAAVEAKENQKTKAHAEEIAKLQMNLIAQTELLNVK